MYAAQNVRLPERCSHRTTRWLIPLIIGFSSVVVGILIGTASASDSSGCEALAAEYAALVSDGLDAGLSGDEASMLAVAEQRDALAERVKNNC